ncbi:GTP-binding protein ERG [Lotus japonicus]|uniref:GTP-binding protein ERG n=1 Tax=Lotus japonicus TaxID=34305 RepID=UPI00258F4C49|nr:GTP-binding protein ERG [Lotus japonicus]
MKALRILRRTLHSTTTTTAAAATTTTVFRAFFSAQPQHDEDPITVTATAPQPSEQDAVFDSSQYEIPIVHDQTQPKPTWEGKYRDRVNTVVFDEKVPKEKKLRLKKKEEEDESKRRALAKALLEAALQQNRGEDEEEEEEEEEEQKGVVKEEDQKSLSVGIIGAPNAGKSALTNFMVGTKVAAVSRKTNTTTHEVVGVMTKEDTQICFFDTPGLMLNCGGFPYRDVKARVESAWSSVNLYEVLIVIFDVHRHLTRPDSRVIKLVKRMGERSIPNQKRILCMNKVDLVEKKKDLLRVAEEFKDLPGYERHFMISGLKGSGVKDLTQYLMEQAFGRPWDEDPFTMSEEVMKMIAKEVVRERLLDHVHQEIPYDIEHKLIDWKELRDGSLRIEQHFITHKLSQRKILVGKNGSKIGRIGIEANEELRTIFKKQVHLILQVRLK